MSRSGDVFKPSANAAEVLVSPSVWQIGLVVLLAVLLFGGRGKLSALMGDLAKGITSFRKGLKDSGDAPTSVSDAGQTIDAGVETAKDKASQ